MHVDSKGNKLNLGDLVSIPTPNSEQGDTHLERMNSNVEDIFDDGRIMFLDEYFDTHMIEANRVTKQN